MIVDMQYKLSSSDLETILAIIRAGTLNDAGKRLGVDGSTIYRSIKRIEKGLGQQLFVRSRNGSSPTELALKLAQHAEQIEIELETAVATSLQATEGSIAGTIKLTTTDTIMQGLLLPTLADLSFKEPNLNFEITTSNEVTSLSLHDADIALRITREPPEHLVGRHIGQVRMAVFGPRNDYPSNIAPPNLGECRWIGTDDYLPKHPSVNWRKETYPRVSPQYKVNSIVSVAKAIESGLGVGLIPLFLARDNDGLVQLSDPIEECETELWLLIRPESRYIHNVSNIYGYLARHLKLQ